MVRAKFAVTSVITTQFGPNHEQKKIVLEPRYDQKIAEDVSFSKATPSGRIEMAIDNPDAIAAMPVGTTFYVDFTPWRSFAWQSSKAIGTPVRCSTARARARARHSAPTTW